MISLAYLVQSNAITFQTMCMDQSEYVTFSILDYT